MRNPEASESTREGTKGSNPKANVRSGGQDMKVKKARKTAKKVKDLPARVLAVKQARGVKGGIPPGPSTGRQAPPGPGSG
jgi:hypothetical protein